MEYTDNILRYLSGKSEFADVRYMSTEGKSYSYRNGQFDGQEQSLNSGYAVRCVNNSIAMAFFNDSDMSSINNKLENLVQNSMKKGKNKIDITGGIKTSWTELGSKKVVDTPDKYKIEFIKNMDSIMQENGANIRFTSLGDMTVSETYANSSGTNITGDFSRLYFVYMAGINDSGSFEESSEEYGSTSGYEYLDSLNFQELIGNDIKNLKASLKAGRLTPGTYDLVVGPSISGIVAHESGGHPMEYDRIIGREAALAGGSFIEAGRKQRIGSENVSLIDDPSIKGSFGYYAYDDEGVKSGKRYLYKKGYTDSYILNRESAAIAGMKVNGGGRSSDWDMEPLARMSTTYIEPGEQSPEELIEGVKHGIYMKNFTEWNIDDTRFYEKYVGKEAYLIDNGKITDIIRRPVLETTTVNFYSSVDASGNDLAFHAGICGKGDPEQGVPVWMGGPHLRLRNMHMK